MTIDPAKTYTAKLSTSCGDVTVALDAKGAPKSVNNFVFLAKQGFYDGLKWPRAAGGLRHPDREPHRRPSRWARATP